MKIRIYSDEFYPFFYITESSDNYGKLVEISNEKAKEYQRILKEFKRLQDELKELVNYKTMIDIDDDLEWVFSV